MTTKMNLSGGRVKGRPPIEQNVPTMDYEMKKGKKPVKPGKC
jgi:hypothetical protein